MNAALRRRAALLQERRYGGIMTISADTKAIDASLYKEVKKKKAEAEKRAKEDQALVKFYDDLLAELKKSATGVPG
jgi:hypothetical protein